MPSVSFGVLLLAIGALLFLDGRSENRFGRSVGRSAEGERIGGKLMAISGVVVLGLGVIIMITGLLALLI